jgi:hypothetical protein
MAIGMYVRKRCRPTDVVGIVQNLFLLLFCGSLLQGRVKGTHRENVVSRGGALADEDWYTNCVGRRSGLERTEERQV